MHLLLHLIQITAMVAIVSGSCSLFGHSCLGGHGKRASADVTLDDIPDWPIHASGVVGVDPVLKRKTNPPLEALESVLALNVGIPRSAEHSRYLDRDYDD